MLASYTPDMQPAVMRESTRYVTRDSPTIADIRTIFSISTAEVWLGNQIQDLNEFAGVTKKLSVRQINDLAAMMASAYYYIKLPEFMLFFARMKCGAYGKFYGCVDTMVITEAFQTFLRERATILDRYKQEQDQRIRLESLDNPDNMDIHTWRGFRPFFHAGLGLDHYRQYLAWLSGWKWNSFVLPSHEPSFDPDPN